MIIYGVALLSACLLSGMIIGQLIGNLVGVGSDIGGVGFAMLLLILITAYLEKKDLVSKQLKQGVSFWSNMYIPIVVAMAASQNVKAAMHGGVMAILAGLLAVVVSFLLIPSISRIGGKVDSQQMTVDQLVKIKE
jgi:malonate transporter MadL subunit